MGATSIMTPALLSAVCKSQENVAASLKLAAHASIGLLPHSLFKTSLRNKISLRISSLMQYIKAVPA